MATSSNETGNPKKLSQLSEYFYILWHLGHLFLYILKDMIVCKCKEMQLKLETTFEMRNVSNLKTNLYRQEKKI